MLREDPKRRAEYLAHRRAQYHKMRQDPAAVEKQREWTRAWYKKNRAKRIKAASEYNRAHPEMVRASTTKYYQKKRQQQATVGLNSNNNPILTEEEQHFFELWYGFEGRAATTKAQKKRVAAAKKLLGKERLALLRKKFGR